MKHIEIPYAEDRGKRYRFFEILPGAITWSILILPFILSVISPRVTTFLIIAYLLMWFAKALGLDIRALQGYHLLNQHQKLPWSQMLEELQTGKVNQPDRHIPSWHYANVRRLQEAPNPVSPQNVLHAVIIATYNESREVLEPTIQSVLESDFDMKRVILVLAYEERGGEAVDEQAKALMEDYRQHFRYAMAVKHPQDIPGEIIGKGGNITFAGRALQKYLEEENIEPLNVVVTTLDADNRPHPKYLPAVTYAYALSPSPVHLSFQPVPMFTNNIWDAPAPMRVIATGNSFWNIVLSLRPHMIRNFSSHAQSMQTLIDTNYWSVRTIVEDGHQFWRTYFRYDGRHEVVPLYLPLYQDAVLAKTYLKTLKAQFIQLRRWAWGASDVAYVAEMGFFRDNKVPKLDLTFKFLRLLEGHITWAVAPLILAGASFIPVLFNPKDYASNQLPIIASRIQTLALVGIVATLFISLKTLPPKPRRYKAHRSLFMIFQWIILPVTTVLYNSFSSLYSQTRLMLGKYLGGFDVTEKAVVTEDKRTIV
jgi:cellulose synthase/poly-beta-1,6-N-acetylglucosamine synthase-like glycosyltransferase